MNKGAGLATTQSVLGIHLWSMNFFKDACLYTFGSEFEGLCLIPNPIQLHFVVPLLLYVLYCFISSMHFCCIFCNAIHNYDLFCNMSSVILLVYFITLYHKCVPINIFCKTISSVTLVVCFVMLSVILYSWVTGSFLNAWFDWKKNIYSFELLEYYCYHLFEIIGYHIFLWTCHWLFVHAIHKLLSLKIMAITFHVYLLSDTQLCISFPRSERIFLF